MSDLQYLRNISLIVGGNVVGEGMDLSQFHIKFNVQAANIDTPNNASVRVYNLSKDHIARITGNYQSVVLGASYNTNPTGTIFSGNVMQYKVGRENMTDTYLDILAADWGLAYSGAFVSGSLEASSATPEGIAKKAVESMVKVNNTATGESATAADSLILTSEGGAVAAMRGTVLFGMSRAVLGDVASSLRSSWSIQNGKVVIMPFSSYSQNEIVVLNRLTGLIGMPEQTDGGIEATCLINPKIQVGNLIRLDSDVVNKMMQSKDSVPVEYGSYTNSLFISPLSPTGLYEVFSIEYVGDTRGQPWYSKLTCLAVDETKMKVIPSN